MFMRAKKILASELMYALDMDEDGRRAAPSTTSWPWRRRTSRCCKGSIDGGRVVAEYGAMAALLLLVAAFSVLLTFPA